MKFRKPEIYEPWSKEKTEAQIAKAQLEKQELCRELNDICTTIRYWMEEKKIMGNKISNKDVYINQLKEQLNEVGEWDEV